MKNLFKYNLLAILSIFLISGCSDDDNPQPVNEEEVITTLGAVFTPLGGGGTVTLQSQDLDGDGPNPPTVTVTGSFQAGTTYSGVVTFLNELENPAEDITEEVEEEAEEHQVFYSVTGGLGTVTYDDSDMDGNPLGLLVTFVSSANPTTGNMTITLRHELDKNAAGVSDGDITNAGGETDIQVTFTGIDVQ